MIDKEIKYCIFDPTGNITALVETEVPAPEQPAAAFAVMEKHPEVEQVGFVSFADKGSVPCENAWLSDTCTIPRETAEADPETKANIDLRMAGGEFCGNATMCAAALYIIRSRQGLTSQSAKDPDCESIKSNKDAADERKTYAVSVSVSGASRPISVKLTENGENSFSAGVDMPPLLGIEERFFECSAKRMTVGDNLPIVHMEGIDHIIIERDSPLYVLKYNKEDAENAVKSFCDELSADCLGLMFMEGTSGRGGAHGLTSGRIDEDDGRSGGDIDSCLCIEKKLSPLVYVPGADTIFWENSCASGTTAAGMWLAYKAEEEIDASFIEPAGILRVKSDPKSGRTKLFGSAILISEGCMYFRFT